VRGVGVGAEEQKVLRKLRRHHERRIRTHKVHAQEIFQLRAEYKSCDAGCESHDDGLGDLGDERARPGGAHSNQHGARHDCTRQQPLRAVRVLHGDEDGDERGGGAADGHAAAAQGGDNDARGDGGVKTGCRGGFAGNAKRHGERQRNDAHAQAGQHVGAQLGGGVAVGEEGQELGAEGGEAEARRGSGAGGGSGGLGGSLGGGVIRVVRVARSHGLPRRLRQEEAGVSARAGSAGGRGARRCARTAHAWKPPSTK
jgi:hypothetical protein